MSRYREIVSALIDENRQVLEAVPEGDVQKLIDEIEKAKTIQLFAMGRMLASLRAFATRLKHMGFDTYVVFDTTTPNIGPGDLLIVNCAVTTIDLGIIKLAKEAGARVCVITAHPENEQGRLADLTVLVPGQIFGTEPEIRSIQPMASLLEQSLFLFEDAVVMLLMEKRSISPQEMQKRHTNLEGVMGDFA
ncbi:MAG: SIS domain-containing protein [Ktedonobacteraceae bacterium]|nr:SIS domain-containing protein [Ktedonobacteraceae bacterium]